MDIRKINELLRATIDPNQRQQAEEQLTQARAHVAHHIFDSHSSSLLYHSSLINNCVLLLFQVHKIIGFAPSLLQVVMSNEIEMPVRQAGESQNYYSVMSATFNLFDLLCRCHLFEKYGHTELE
jgi:hypothetical protein